MLDQDLGTLDSNIYSAMKIMSDFEPVSISPPHNPPPRPAPQIGLLEGSDGRRWCPNFYHTVLLGGRSE